ncbi:MAG TPA: biotin/lipoyl-binding protein, partial [Candidatus Binatia bacterium]|nr:biotin/lipoyl-binding protein [Candidatus Binatia bacterium]
MKSTEINTGTYENDLGGIGGGQPRGKPAPPAQSFAPSPRWHIPGWAVAALIAVISAAVAFMAGTKMPPSRPAASSAPAASVMSVSVEGASTKPVHKVIDVTGSIWAWDPLVISAEVAGLKIETVRVEEGNNVREGQVLATLNASILNSELEREKAALASSQAALAKAIQPNRREDINWLRAA